MNTEFKRCKVFWVGLFTLGDIFMGDSFAKAQLDCDVIEAFGNPMRTEILQDLNERTSGQRHRINRRKTLRINHIEDVSFQGCTMIARIDVTLERRIRRDAHGIVQVSSEISSLNIPERSFCIENPRVNSVNLSRTLRIGEAFYRWVANQALPDSSCFSP